MNSLLVRNVSKKLGNKIVLDQINLKIEPGLFGLLGPNGAGKTTLMRILATVMAADEGEVTYLNLKWREHPDLIRKRLGYLPQQFGMYRNLTTMESMDYIAEMKGIGNRRQRMQHCESILEKVNLLQETNTKIGHFSGGMLRRLGIAQALLGEPQILLVDEPTAGLDPEERIRFRNMLRKLGRERIVVLSTHIVEDISTTCHALAVLKYGKAYRFDSISDLAAVAQGKVWKYELHHHEYNVNEIGGEIMSTHITQDKVELRVLSDSQPDPNAVPCNPNIEEGYLVWNRLNCESPK